MHPPVGGIAPASRVRANNRVAIYVVCLDRADRALPPFGETPAVRRMLRPILLGPWDGRRIDLFGSNPSAVLVFDAIGRFAAVSTRPDLPKFVSGTYSVVDKVIIAKVEGSTWPSWISTDQKRTITLLREMT